MENFAELKRGAFRLKVSPNLGGRITEFSLDGFNFLFENQSLKGTKNIQPEKNWNGVWQNFGGEKIWPAPQGWDNDRQWSGPPDPFLDGGYFDLVFADSEKISTRSPVDPRTGLQIFRDISILPSQCGVKIDASFLNHSEKKGEWSIWPVIQTAAVSDADDRYAITFPAKNGYSVMHGVANNPQYSLDDCGNCKVSYKYIVGKVGAESDGGWVAYADTENGKTFVASYDYVAAAKYPCGTNVQIWSAGKGAFYSRSAMKICPNDRTANPAYMEIELLSPLAEISKNEKCNFSYVLRACTIPRGGCVRSVFEFGALSQKLSLEKRGGKSAISASLGVFAEGEISLKTDGGKTLCAPVKASPLSGVEISLEIENAELASSREIILEYFNNKHRLTIEKIEL